MKSHWQNVGYNMRRVAVLAMMVLLVPIASANYSMWPALWMFQEWTVPVYICVTLVFEAWFIGNKIDQSWGRIFVTCIAANFFTGIFGFIFGIPTLRKVLIGDPIDPNPLLTAVFALTVFATISAPVESLAWMTIRKDMPKTKVFTNTLLAHLIGIPLGLAIFLIPSRPYAGLEFYVAKIRNGGRSSVLTKFSTAEGDVNVPVAKSAEEFFEHVVTQLKNRPEGNPAGLGAILPEGAFRFDTNFRRGEHFEFNEQVSGKALRDLKVSTWILRRRTPHVWGYVYDPAKRRIASSHSELKLGY